MYPTFDGKSFDLHAASLKPSGQGERVSRIMNAALQAVAPHAAVRRFLQREGDTLFIGDRKHDLTAFRRVFIVGAGKAGAPMAWAVAEVLGEHLSDGVVIAKEGYLSPDLRAHQSPNLLITQAGHPLPDERGVRGAQQILDLLENTQADDLVIAVISGGASALLVSPAEGLTLADLQGMTSVLLACGADIYAINTLRKHCERLKGGQLARQAAPAALVTLILSDVVGDSLEVIGSGPTVPDPTTYADAYAVLKRYDIEQQVPPAIVQHLRRGLRHDIPETPKPENPLFARVHHVLVGSNRQAAEAALAQARAEGFHTLLLTTFLQGEARQAGRFLAAIAREIVAHGQPLPRPTCIIAGGETTVTLHGAGGLGGRNQELALGAVKDLAGLPEIALMTLATDGGDGPTNAAGAVVTGETLARARSLGLDPADYLARNDAYHFFEKLGDLLKPGPTQTNVNDLAVIFAF
jgi:hydroxypyruvate reductase